jgi:drug/metabolite transporter (DMT)-like permease
MSSASNATGSGRETASAPDGAASETAPPATGVLLGFVGVLAFSFSLPATRLAVEDLDPWFVAFGRAAVAAVLAAVVLAATKAKRPTRAQLKSLVLVAAGVVFGFPIFTSFALEDRTAAHSAVVIGLLPIATAVFAVARAHERPTRAFWAAALTGTASVLLFAATAGAGGPQLSDLLLLGAVVSAGLGYAEGGRLSRELGGAQTICWALVIALPLTLPVSVATVGPADTTSWLGFAYNAGVSMFLGFFAWYAGLARGGVAKIGQVQLAQPILTLALSAAILGESVSAATIGAAVFVLASVAATQRARVRQDPPPCRSTPPPSARRSPPRPTPSAARR